MISVIIPTWDQGRADKTVALMKSHQAGEDVEYIVYAGKHSAVEGMWKGGALAKGGTLMFVHDDVDVLKQGWDHFVVSKFLDPGVGLVGFCGALGLGTDELYRKPYKLQQLARICFMSNADDWEIHGYRLERPRKVVVLDGLCQIFRRDAYEDMGGWEACLEDGITFHMYDAWAACQMAEWGWDVWALPIRYHHHGGLTSTSKEYDEFLRKQGINGDLEIHRLAHVVIYDRFRGVLPLHV